MTTPAKTPPAGTADANASAMIEIFKAGKHTDMSGRVLEFTEADLADIASGYDPKTSEAPLVVGHPTLNAPAYGWVQKVVAKGKSLFAVPHQVDPAFAAMQNEGKFKKRSPSFILPDAANNPTPGKFYLRHVGFLGAAAPAVKGLQDYTFADEGKGTVEFAADDRTRWGFGALADLFRGLRDRMIETDGLDKANATIPDYQIEYLRDAAKSDPSDADDDTLPSTSYAANQSTEEDPMTDKTAEFAAREAALNTTAADLATREKKIADAEKAARRVEIVSYADGLVAAGKLLPRQKGGVVELLLVLPPETAVSFAEGDKTIEKPAATVLRELFDTLPTQINFAEKSRDIVTGETISFAAPVGVRVDPDKADLWSKAKAYQTTHQGVSLVDAYKAVGGA